MARRIVFRYLKSVGKVVPLIKKGSYRKPKPWSQLADRIDRGLDLRRMSDELKSLELLWKKARKTGQRFEITRHQFAKSKKMIGRYHLEFTDAANFAFMEGYGGRRTSIGKGKKIFSKRVKKLARRDIKKAVKIKARYERLFGKK